MSKRNRQDDREYVATGIYRRGNKFVAEVRHGSRHNGGIERPLRKEFPLTTPLAEMIAWQLDAKSKLIKTRAARAERGTLAADVPVFLSKIPDDRAPVRYKKDTEQLMAHWSASPLGAMARHAIERLDVIGQITDWTNAGVANSTCNRRLSRLRKFYAALDGVDRPNPTDKIERLPGAERELRDISTRIVNLILNSLDDRGRAEKNEKAPTVSITKIRLRVMAWTGMAPATMRRLTSRHLELDKQRAYLTARRKGKHGKTIYVGAWVALTPPAIDALRDFAAANLFGTCGSNSSRGKTWRVGIKRAIVKAQALADSPNGDASWLEELKNLPPHCRPYDLRHSFAAEMYRVTKDIRTVQQLLQHASPETTDIYTHGAVSEVVAAGILKASETVYANIPTMPTPKPARQLRVVHAS